jgi:hypothetical protein
MLSRQFVVHPNVDLDAVVSLAILGASPEEIHFVPAGAKKLPDALSGARVVDHPLGEKGRLDANKVRHAAACSLPEAAGWNPALLAEVDEQDSTGLVKEPRFSLAAILAAIKATVKAESLNATFEAMDREVYRLMRPIIAGLNIVHRQMEEARPVAKTAVIEDIGGFKVAVLHGNAGDAESTPALGMVLNAEYGVSVQVYADGHNIGVFRYPGRNTPDLTKLAPALGIPAESIGKNQLPDGRPCWFVIPSGFLACWGSKKSPVTSPSPEGTPRTVEGLLELLRKTYA